MCLRHEQTGSLQAPTSKVPCTLLCKAQLQATMDATSLREGAAAAFPTDPSTFDSDDRISFSQLDGKFLLVQEDGSEYEFDNAIKRWIPVLDEALLEEQQRAYRVSGVDENAPVQAGQRKRKAEYVNGEDVSLPSPLCQTQALE